MELEYEVYPEMAESVLAEIAAAIEALPAFLRDVTRLRLLEHHSYERISTVTGKTPATLRAYLNKALGLLRRNETLCTLLQEMRD